VVPFSFPKRGFLSIFLLVGLVLGLGNLAPLFVPLVLKFRKQVGVKGLGLRGFSRWFLAGFKASYPGSLIRGGPPLL